MTRYGVGIIGAGNIATQYLDNLTQFEDVDVLFIADLQLDRAAARASQYNVPHYGTVDQLLARDDIQIVVNLTIPAVHAEVSQQIIAAGKHIWSEKPIATDQESAADLLRAADAAGLRVACAPDTVLGGGIQTALRAIARGDIGEPLTASTMFHVPGPDKWHPDPEFLYAQGAGPLFDIGPYYITTLVNVFGSASKVHAVASQATKVRTIGSGPRAGTRFDVEVPTHHAALIEFEGGGSAQSTLSFEHAFAREGVVEINGTEGTLILPDPNVFDGDSTLWRFGQEGASVIPCEGSTWGRGTGVVELARAISAGEPERASGAIAAHVLDILVGIDEAATKGAPVTISSRAQRMPPLPAAWDPSARTELAVGPNDR